MDSTNGGAYKTTPVDTTGRKEGTRPLMVGFLCMIYGFIIETITGYGFKSDTIDPKLIADHTHP